MTRLHASVFVVVLALAACGPEGGAAGGGGGSDAGVGGDGAGASDGAWVVDAPSWGDVIEGCDPKSFTLQQSPPAQVYLVVDRSGSMAEEGSSPSTTKWQELRGAVDQVLTQFEGAIEFGLLSYPGDAECTTPGPQVKFDLFNRVPVLEVLSGQTPSGGTPTAAALTNAASSLRALGRSESPKILVLATDGGPNCNFLLEATPLCVCSMTLSESCCTSHPAPCVLGKSCLDDTHTLEVITNLHTDDAIDTFVIGLAGSGEYAELLDLMATAGGRPRSGSPAYYPATSQSEIQAALQEIAVSVISCAIDLDEAPDNPEGVLIYLDGGKVPRDPTRGNGWDYTDDSFLRIELFGATCETLRDGQAHDIVATEECVLE